LIEKEPYSPVPDNLAVRMSGAGSTATTQVMIACQMDPISGLLLRNPDTPFRFRLTFVKTSLRAFTKKQNGPEGI
jgi:hypothetical protein